jgi:hypothetical protein
MTSTMPRTLPSTGLAARALRAPFAALALLFATFTLLTPSTAAAQAVIKQPGAHPRYSFEAEPHLLVNGRGHGGDAIGPGFRGTVVLVDNGFISTINNSVGIGFGADFLLIGDKHCHGRDQCHRHDVIILPVVLQWNFWLHRKWSVFGEPGVALVLNENHNNDDLDDTDLDVDPFVFGAGGRYHFSDSTTLTMRLGFPVSLSIGVSFLL